MSIARTLLAAVGFAAAASAAQAQFVNRNEAVKGHADGMKTVEPSASLAALHMADGPVCLLSAWRMAQTRAGLQECIEFYARPRTCRASTYGTEKRDRLWIVKLKGQWMQRRRPDLTGTRVSTRVLSTTIIQ